VRAHWNSVPGGVRARRESPLRLYAVAIISDSVFVADSGEIEGGAQGWRAPPLANTRELN